MATIAVPAPALEQAKSPGSTKLLEQPVSVKIGAPLFPDGSAYRDEDRGVAGFLVYRQLTAGSLWQVWSEPAKLWQPSGAGDLALPPLPVSFKPGDPQPWQGILAAAGQTDALDQPRFATPPALSAFPRYSVKALFAATRNGEAHAGLSIASPAITFTAMADAMRAGLAMPPDNDPMAATELTIFLRDGNRTTIGSIDIRAGGGGAEIVIENFGAGGGSVARIELSPSGGIRLRPAAGQRVTIDGVLQAEQIDYRHNGAGAMQTL